MEASTQHRVDPVFNAEAVAAVWREEIARHWKRVLAVGIGCVIVGLLAVAIPIAASISVAVLTGWILLIAGAIQLGYGVRTRMWWRVLMAALAVVAGGLILIFPLEGTITLTMVLVAWFWASGAHEGSSPGGRRAAPRAAGCSPWAACCRSSWAR